MSDTVRAKNLLKTKGILTFQDDATLGQVLANLNSSHDAGFILKDDRFLGIINPYYTQFKSNYPPQTKVAHCLFNPPKLVLDTTLADIARYMLESKIYFLPVCDDTNQLLGIVTIRRLLRAALKDKTLSQKLSTLIKTKPLTTISKNTPINKARTLLTKSRVSRLPVVTDQGRLIGLVTRYDLRAALIKPQTSQSFLSRSGEKIPQSDQPIDRHMVTNVFTTTKKKNSHNLVETMLTNNIGSIIIVNQKNQPTGIVTYRDILTLIQSPLIPGPQYKLTLPKNFKFQKNFSRDLKAKLKPLLKLKTPKQITARLKTTPTANRQKTDGYQVDIRVNFIQTARSAFATVRDHDYKKALNLAVAKIKAQLKPDDH